jgi:hypothetical protein
MFRILLAMLLLAWPVEVRPAVSVTSLSGIKVSTADHNAGAITSIIWGGREFIDDKDHGRQCQSASTFGQGESFNPTEAGASVWTDGMNPSPSSSKLIWEVVAGNTIMTRNQMAYWYPVANVRLSRHYLQKSVAVGLPDLPNVIEHTVYFTLPDDEIHTYAQFEALTCYMHKDFRNFYTVEISSQRSGDVIRRSVVARPLSDGPGEQPKPVFFSTDDGKYAIGVYSSTLPQLVVPWADQGFGRWRFWDTMKWNVVYRVNNPTPGATYTFKQYIIVGDSLTVMEQMAILMKRYPQPG